MAASFFNCFSMAEVECAAYIADAVGLEIGHTAFIGPQTPYPNCMTFEFAGSAPNDSAYLSAQSMSCVPMSARATISHVSRDSVWEWISRVVNALPVRNPTENVELLRIASIGAIMLSDYQFANEKVPRALWTCQLTFNAVVLTGGKIDTRGA